MIPTSCYIIIFGFVLLTIGLLFTIHILVRKLRVEKINKKAALNVLTLAYNSFNFLYSVVGIFKRDNENGLPVKMRTKFWNDLQNRHIKNMLKTINELGKISGCYVHKNIGPLLFTKTKGVTDEQTNKLG